jgi:hypothetical protein
MKDRRLLACSPNGTRGLIRRSQRLISPDQAVTLPRLGMFEVFSGGNEAGAYILIAQ